MPSKRLVLSILVVFVSIIGAGTGQAQETQSIRFLDGGKPMPDLPISEFIDEGKPVGTSDANGGIDIPLDVLDFGKGEEVAVWVKRCEDGTVTEVILTPADADNPCPPEEGAEAGERCGCERIGTFIWGGGPVDIDVTRGTVDQQRTGLGGGPRIGETFAVGIKLNASNMLNLEDVAGSAEGATSVDATTWAPGVAVFFEMTPFGPVAIGVAGTYSQMETETSFGSVVQTGDINYYSLGPYGRVDLGRGFNMGMRVVPFLEGSAAYSWNKGDFSVDGVSDHRVHKTWRGEFGGGLYHFSTPNWGWIFQVLYSTTGEDNDADEHVRIGGGVIWRPFNRPVF